MKFNNKAVRIAFAAFFLIATRTIASHAYVIPVPEIEALKPRGLRVSIPDETGIQFFAFHGNVNNKIGATEIGSVSGDVFRPQNGKWIFQDQRVSLRNQDVLHYWIYVQVNGVAHTKAGQSWTPTPKPGPGGTCNRSITIIQNGVQTCQGQLIFDENFDSLNSSVWVREVKIPFDPDYEFCVYHNQPESVQVQNGIFRVTPSLLEESYGEGSALVGKIQLSESTWRLDMTLPVRLDFYHAQLPCESRCSSQVPNECTQQAVSYHILPPVISARLTTAINFSFRYGRIDLRAKFPEGDWLYPEMWLQPKSSMYGEKYMGGRIRLGMARGNPELVKISGGNRKEIGGKNLEFGVRMGSWPDVREETVKTTRNSGTWTSEFHVYSTTWSTDGFVFRVDGEEVGRMTPGPTGWSHGNQSSPWAKGTIMAPFDEEFYINLGVGVGGVREFPDGTMSGQYAKPWKNDAVKAKLRFWQAKDQWLPSWRNGNVPKTALEVDYVRVWAI